MWAKGNPLFLLIKTSILGSLQRLFLKKIGFVSGDRPIKMAH
jgi:hypothetical protein